MEGGRFQREPPKQLGDLVTTTTPHHASSRFGGIKIGGNMLKEEEAEEEEEEEEEEKLYRSSPQSFPDSPPLPPSKKRERSVTPEKKAAPPSPPPPPPVARLAEVGFIIRLILYATLIFGGLFFYGMVSISISHDVSLPRAAAHLFAWQMLTPIAAQPLRIKGTVYPLYTKQHETDAVNLVLTQHHARPLVSSLESSFAHYLLSNSLYPCLCMHHMRVPSDQRFALCAASNRDYLYLMANPTIIGGSNETVLLHETSISCDGPYHRRRHLTVFVSWECPLTKQHLYSRFEGETAMCLQIAHDELQGNAHCENEE